MSERPKILRLIRRDPQITVLPHISAPIDEGPLLPYPPRPLREKLLAIFCIVTFAIVVLGYTFYRSTDMH